MEINPEHFKNIEGKNILLIGAGGNIGVYIAQILSQIKNYRFLRLMDVKPISYESNFSNDNVECNFGPDIGNVQSYDSVKNALNGIDTVLFVVGVRPSLGMLKKQKSLLFQTELKGIENIIQFFDEEKGDVNQIIYISSLAAGELYPVGEGTQIKKQVDQILRYEWEDRRQKIFVSIKPSGYFFDIFEMPRYFKKLSLDVMLPKDGEVYIQPIAEENVAEIVLRSVDNENVKNNSIHVGGPKRYTYHELFTNILKEIFNHKFSIDGTADVDTCQDYYGGSDVIANRLNTHSIITDIQLEDLTKKYFLGIKLITLEDSVKNHPEYLEIR